MKGRVKLKDNSGGKAACWKKFKLVETDDGNDIFRWAVCADCFVCIMYKSAAAVGSVKLYGTTNMTDHAKRAKFIFREYSRTPEA